MGLVRTILLIVIAILSTIFVIQNLASVEVSFLTWSIIAPRAVIFSVLLVLGLVAGYLLHALKMAFRPRAKPRDANDVQSDPTPPQPGRE